MRIDVAEEPMAALAEYALLPIAFLNFVGLRHGDAGPCADDERRDNEDGGCFHPDT